MESVVDVSKEEYEFSVESTASLSNSDVLSNLYSKLQLLSPKQTEDIHQLLIDFPGLCRDVPRPYNKIEHDVVLCESVVPIKQAQYRGPNTHRTQGTQVNSLAAGVGLPETLIYTPKKPLPLPRTALHRHLNPSI
ncbi:hypothetical protein Pcinc_029217 [Petrolisthes cinctipes]|uniref:Uncharacterized protein n=1 Tax=Petrolisthes cinctipes TaxID=88211 RepID=A0AAE1F1B6_PETCI|nr:hypothetical protein Pcinc_029217 [Petrolisthes cinctipes]